MGKEDFPICPKCGHSVNQHYMGEGWGPPEYKCWERDYPYCNGRCGCKYKIPIADTEV